MRKFKCSMVLLIVLFFSVSCTSFFHKDVGTEGSRATADYVTIGQKIFVDTKMSIDSICPNIPDADCRKAKRIFNYTVDIYDITGEYVKAIVDSENISLYVENAASKMLVVLDEVEYDSDIKAIIQGIDEIIKATDETDPEIKALKILQIMNLKMLPAIADILEPIIVEDN